VLYISVTENTMAISESQLLSFASEKAAPGAVKKFRGKGMVVAQMCTDHWGRCTEVHRAPRTRAIANPPVGDLDSKPISIWICLPLYVADPLVQWMVPGLIHS